MNWLTEFLKQLPEIIKAASATQLSLAAAIVIAGAIVVMYLMRSVSAVWRLLAFIAWLIVALLVLWLIVDGSSNGAGCKVRVIGQEFEVVGYAVELDLGIIPASQPVETNLSIDPPTHSLPVGIGTGE